MLRSGTMALAFGRRLNCLRAWHATAAAVANWCGQDAALAREIMRAIDAETASVETEAAEALATPAERKRAAARALRSSGWQASRRDRDEERADRRRAVARAWWALQRLWEAEREVSRG